MPTNKIKIGFFNKDKPFVENSATEEEVEKSILLLRHHIIPKAFERHYRVLTMCPICGCFNHASEYEFTQKTKLGNTKTMVFPKGLEHIILKHKVLVPQLLKMKFPK